MGFLTVYLTEPFISGFTTGAAIHVFTSQIPSIFGVKTPGGISRAFRLPKLYIQLIRSIFQNINWMSTAIGIVSSIVLYVSKYLSERYRAKIRVSIPCELILVSFYFHSNIHNHSIV